MHISFSRVSSKTFSSRKSPRTHPCFPPSVFRLQRSPCRDLAASCAEMPHSLKHSLPDDEQDAFYVPSSLPPLHPKRSFAPHPTPSSVPTQERRRRRGGDKIHS
ncbi:hypothetical protein AVEN_205498-1 [Araneus ventricosus]|uniref:Uncharacterized protein n=1 Tax=Araneus ventricosus TaxID=182803 RepID=A0A4Y2LBD8_ARAVE|nr:hypothetical protein AVEN_205498-1 [Araneus ventricosus]